MGLVVGVPDGADTGAVGVMTLLVSDDAAGVMMLLV
jgi:hypothetical protein